MQREVEQLNQLLTQVRCLPPLSQGVTRLMALNPHDAALVEKTTQIIEADPALAAQLLKIANSAAFTGQQIVDTVERAIMRVGVRMIVGTVAQTQLQRTFEPVEDVMMSLWLANVLGANIAMQIATAAPTLGVIPETAYTYGLLHDVGRLVMVQLLGSALKEIVSEAPPIRTELARREQALFGFDHVTAGRLLGNRWKLPTDMTLVIAAHHLPPERRTNYPVGLNKIIDILALADEITHFVLVRGETLSEIEKGLPTLLESVAARPLVDAVGAGPAALHKAVLAALDAVEKQRQTLGLVKQDSPTSQTTPAPVGARR